MVKISYTYKNTFLERARERKNKVAYKSAFYYFIQKKANANYSFI